jgi:hypothetical protein
MDQNSDQSPQQAPTAGPSAGRLPPVFEVWREYEQVAMHFNDLLMRLRSQSLAAIVAFTALAGVVLQRDAASGFRCDVLAGVFLLLTLCWVAIWILDFGYYNRLLLGAVEALLTVEELSKSGAAVSELVLSTQIEVAVAGRIASRKGAWARAKARWWFYGIVFFALGVGLVASTCAGGGVRKIFSGATSTVSDQAVPPTGNVTRPVLSGMSLFDCEGKETGKVEGFVAKEQLLMACAGKECQAQFGIEKFEAVRDEDGRYSGLSHYFDFDPGLGTVQGIVGAPYHYFTGKCVEREQG